MAGRFVLRRSELAREPALKSGQTSAERVRTLVRLVTSLADRMDALPSLGLDGDRERQVRVQVLRRTADAGRRALAQRAGGQERARR